MFYQLLLIHLYRPFLKYTKSTTPLPQHVSPRKLCSQAASAISKLLRIYKRSYGFSQICNIVVYIAHTACTIHLLNLPDKPAQRDVVHGLRHLEEMGESWLCARRTLRILDISANKWKVQLPSEAVVIFERTHMRWGSWGSWDQAASPANADESTTVGSAQPSATIPSRFSSPGAGVPGGQHVESSVQGATHMAGIMPSQYRPPSSIPTSLPTIQAAQRSSSAQIQQTDAPPLPEPTYLRPSTNMYFPMNPVPLPQNDGWYGGQESQLQPLNDEQNPPPTADSSSMTGFDPSENLVEESQDWWSRNPTTLNLGIENWEGWQHNPSISAGPPMQVPTPDLHYGGDIPAASVNNSPAPKMQQPMGLPVGVPNPNPPGYNPMLFPRAFTQ